MLALVVLAGSPVAQAMGAQQRLPADTARQSMDTLALDSLRARLARAEAAIALLREQLAGESESAVRTKSRLHVELSAQVLTNSFLTLGRVNNVDVPQTVLAPPAAGATPATNDALGFTLRQTRIGVAASVADVLGGTFGGDVDFDLYGGVQDGPGDRRLFPELRLRTARAHLVWSRTELMVGSETPLISDLNPMSLAAVGVPGFSGAGNLWNWLAQVRITREIAAMGPPQRSVRWAIQGAVLAPYANTVIAGEPDGVDAAERSRRPTIEARLRARWGDEEERAITGTEMIGDRGGEIGVGMHRGWMAIAPGVLGVSHAVSLDAHIVPLRGVELRGEAYAGQLLRGLGGGGIAQNFGRVQPGAPPGSLGPAVRDVAGWAQLNVQPHPVLVTGIGCGLDLVDPDANPTRLQNTVCAAHAAWRPMQPLVIGVEYRQLGTRFATGTFGARHVNLVLGFEL
ncbi:MAG: hypothetical protein M3282_06755 [Gemmatimonadota bacterium]|nr:hypothetical protein [Gemmatimonadota bacterium]